MYSKTKPKQVYFSQTVTKIDYSGPIVKIHTKDKIYLTEKVVSSLPLGVLQANKVEFIPKLPQSQTKAFNDLGNGVYNKILVSFEKPFIGKNFNWLHLISKENTTNRYK